MPLGDIFQPILCQKSKSMERFIFCRHTDLALDPNQPHSAPMAALLEQLLPWAVCTERSTASRTAASFLQPAIPMELRGFPWEII